MGEKNKQGQKQRHGQRPTRLTTYVAYVVSVTSVKCKCDTPEQARDWAAKEVMNRLATIDSNVYTPKVAVIEATDDQEQEENIKNATAPWLTDGFGPPPEGEPS